MGRSGRSRRVVRVLAANAAVFAALLLALEGAVRVARPDVGPAGSEAALLVDSAFVDAEGRTPGLRPGAVGRANGETVRVDGSGYHLLAGNVTAPDSAGVWLWLGDSVLFGLGVPADSGLAGRVALAQDTARALSPAVLGWGTQDYRRRLDAALRAGLRPARVTVVWCLNDADPGRPSAPGTVPLLVDWRRKATVWLNAHSRLYRLAKGVALDRPARYYAYDRTFYEPLAEVERPPARADTALAHLRAVADTLAARDIPLDVVVVPYEPQLRPGGDALPQEVLVPRLRSWGLPVLDLLPAFRAAGGEPERLYLWSDGIHLSAAGHAVAASAVARWEPHSPPSVRPPETAPD